MLISFSLAMAGGYLMHLISKIPYLGWSLVPPKLPETDQKITRKLSEPSATVSPESLSMKS